MEKPLMSSIPRLKYEIRRSKTHTINIVSYYELQVLFANFHRENWVIQITTAVRWRSWPGIMKWPPILIPRTCVESFSKLYLYFCVRKFRINAYFMVSNLLVMVIWIVLRRHDTIIPANSNLHLFYFVSEERFKL